MHSRDNDLVVNPSKAKKLTNIRTTAADEKLFLTPPRELSLEAALEFINDDELVEVTPKAIRLRKRVLDHNERKRVEKLRDLGRGGVKRLLPRVLVGVAAGVAVYVALLHLGGRPRGGGGPARVRPGRGGGRAGAGGRQLPGPLRALAILPARAGAAGAGRARACWSSWAASRSR